MRTLTGFARGFLSLVELFDAGQNPRLLLDELRATVDLGDLYLLSKQIGYFGSNIAPANGFNLLTGPAGVVSTVPAGEVWRLHFCTLIMTAGAGAAINAAPGIRIDGNAIPLAPMQVVAATQTWSAPMIADPIWLNSGTDLGFYAQGVVLAPVVSFTAVISRLRA